MRNDVTVPAELITEWEICFSKLKASGRFPNLCSEPFLGFRPVEYEKSEVKILYVGKATKGDPGSEELERVYRSYSSPFWNFARELRRVSEEASGKTTSVAWSNLCKIGVVSGNPNNALVREQATLASKTLRSELQSAGVNLAVFVCEGYADTLVYSSLGLDNRSSDPIEDFGLRIFGTDEYWIRQRKDGFPPILWVQHPQGKLREKLGAWKNEVLALLS